MFGTILKRWIQTSEGCKIYNPNPLRKETITWTGTCSGGYASGTGTLQWYKNGKPTQQYIGEMKRGSPDGQGRYLFEDGAVREGTYSRGDLNGIGTITRKYKSGNINYFYSGDIRDDFPSGRGQELEFSESGDTTLNYVGEFFEGEKHGDGTLKTNYRNYVVIKKGKFDQGVLAGNVEIYRLYEGRQLDYYRGEYRDYGRNGYGESITGINRYVGNWSEDRREGMGKIYLDTLLVYEGQWAGDKFHGSGKRYYFDGSSYFGEFKENHRHGIGTQRWTNGSIYIGEFNGDLYSGYGYVITDGKIIACGIWVSGSLMTKVDFKRTKDMLTSKYKSKLALFGINLM